MYMQRQHERDDDAGEDDQQNEQDNQDESLNEAQQQKVVVKNIASLMHLLASHSVRTGSSHYLDDAIRICNAIRDSSRL